MSTPEPGSPADAPSGTVSSRASIMPQRVLACVLCQKRKIKCDRQFPCAHCLKISAQCVQATSHPRQKHRRFPERELLGRLRRYEALLRQNNIKFEPMHTDAADHASRSEDGRDADEDIDTPYPRHPVREDVLKEAWAHASNSKDNFLFGSRKANADLSTLHPLQAHIFRLWQIYLENVDPLLKITHTPTLQTRIIDAASDVTSIDPALEALMFGIYCTSVLSLVEDECRTLFASPKDDLLQSYQFGCEQALLKCEVLRTDDRNCLTALYLYLLSLRPGTDPRSVSSMLGVAIRIAQRLGIHTETMNARCTALEAEMRRRLWWALVTFDHRICELANSKTTMLNPTWDCKIPQSLNDFDIRPEMKYLPQSHETPTEALFAVMRGELGEFTRHSSTLHLDFTSPSLKVIAKGSHGNLDLENDELSTLETAIEAKYLRLCNTENPLHFMTIWTTRGYFARNRLLEHHLEHSRSSDQQTDIQRGAAVSYAMTMLECDTMIMTSPLSKGYVWYAHNYFPFLAYVYIVQDLKKRPVQDHTEKAWNAMNNNYDARFKDAVQGDNPLFKIFSGTVLEAWNAREAASRTLSKPLDQPRIVSDIKCKLAQLASNAQTRKVEQSSSVANTNIEDLSLPTPTEFAGYGLMGVPDLEGWASGGYLGLTGSATPNFNMNQPGWNTMPWNPMYAPGW